MFQLYEAVSRLAEIPNAFDNCESQLVQCVKTQMDLCNKGDTEQKSVSSHTPQYTLVLTHDHAPCTESSGMCGQLQCESCRCPFLFYDNQRQAALTRFSDASDLVTLSDPLITIHQCE